MIGFVQFKFRGKTFSTWDAYKVNKGDLTVQEFVDAMAAEHGIKVSAISVGVRASYSL